MRIMMSVVALVAFLGNGSLFAEEAEKSAFGFEINHGILSYSSETQKTKPDGGTEVEQKTDDLQPSVDDVEIAIKFSDYILYVNPWDADSGVSLGYGVMENLEVGVTVGIRDTKVDKLKDESSATKVGLGVTYFLGVSEATTLEIALGVESAAEKTEKEEADSQGNITTSKTDISATTVEVGVDAVVQFASNFAYVGGIGYSMTDAEEKESKTKISTSGFSVNIASLRYMF